MENPSNPKFPSTFPTDRSKLDQHSMDSCWAVNAKNEVVQPEDDLLKAAIESFYISNESALSGGSILTKQEIVDALQEIIHFDRPLEQYLDDGKCDFEAVPSFVQDVWNSSNSSAVMGMIENIQQYYDFSSHNECFLYLLSIGLEKTGPEVLVEQFLSFVRVSKHLVSK